METDVLIAGAGPVGLVMSIELARYGVVVRIIDKAPQRTDKSKALVIWSRSPVARWGRIFAKALRNSDP